MVILGAVVLVAYLGVRTSSSVDLVLVAGEVAAIAGLAVTILIKITRLITRLPFSHRHRRRTASSPTSPMR